PEEEPEEDVDIELEDDAESIFPYEVEGDKTLPPGDVSSNFGSSNSESEDEEIRENVTLKKRLAETETKLVWARMECDTAKRRLHESRVWNKMFYLDMVRIGAVLKPPSNDEDTEHPRKKLKN
nr:hypothetical protein [Tanacetum cinerariifolium]